MSSPSRHQSPSIPSTSSLKLNRRPPPPTTTVITTPPWARDEPPSPTDDTFSDSQAAESRPAGDVASYNASTIDLRSRWWTFTMSGTAKSSHGPNLWTSSSAKSEKRGFKEFSKSWLPASTSTRGGTSFPRKEKDTEHGQTNDPRMHHDFGLSLALPTPPAAPYVFAQNTTPGWDSPWSPHLAQPGIMHVEERNNLYDRDYDQESTGGGISGWQRKKKKVRTFILTNVYVPLLFRFINITFTATALAVAIHIRKIEIKGGILGAVGSSPTLVIIFAPLTLVHVIVAIYLEYFGRPLGLWRTSGKLMHTLSEVLFICAWSAAFSLCFDNFFTSLIPCASASSMSWYNQLPRPPSTVPVSEGGLGNGICNNQLALICLVGIGLMAYCGNLIISLFRIFEKVKYHPAARIRR